jgi:hypothetical protein
MPVKWIYVLQDGTLTSPTSGSGATATFAYGDIRQPSQTNPIVGRIAFWTDDETCKVNVNTAAGFADGVAVLPTGYTDPSQYAGSYWDSPRFYTQFDYGQPGATGLPLPNQPSGGLALCQLLQNEFQRYPGHPATTSLAPIFKNFFTSEQVYGFVPRYSNLNLSGQPSSTKGGTNRIFIDNTAAGTGNTLQFDQLQPKQDRLYSSLDELLFGAHGLNLGQPSYIRQDNISYIKSTQGSTPNVTSQQWANVLDKTRFFLTAQSRAPELNLYGQPRVSAWPVRYEPATGTSGMNVFDNLILFCSTVGTAVNPAANGRPDTTGDAANTGLYRYIFTRKEIVPGTDTVSGTFGVAGSSPSQFILVPGYVPDWQQLRNSELLQTYLPQFFNTNRPIPGFGTVWGATNKYTAADTQSVLAEIFDYIRCANSQDTTTSLSSGKAIEFAPRGYIMPSTPSFYNSGGIQAKGLGRMSTLCEATVDFYYAGPVMETTPTIGNPTGVSPGGVAQQNTGWSHWDPTSANARFCQVDVDSTGTKIRPKFRYMRAFVVFSTFDPMQGYAPKSDVYPLTDPKAGQLVPNDVKLTIQAKWENDWSVYFGSGGNTFLGFPTTGSPIGGGGIQTTVYRSPGSYWGGRNFGGYEGFMHTLIGDGGDGTIFKHKIMWDPMHGLQPLVMVSGTPTGDYGESYDPATGANPAINYVGFTSVQPANQEYYPFQSSAASPVKVPTGTETFGFNGGNVDVSLYYGGQLMQSYVLNFQSSSGQSWPVPTGDPGQFATISGATLNPLLTSGKKVTSADVTTWNATTDSANYGAAGYGTSGGNPSTTGLSSTNQGAQGMSRWYWLGNGCFYQPGITARRGQQNYKILTSLQASWSFATRLAWAEQENGNSNNPTTDINLVPIEWTGGLMSGVSVSGSGSRWQCIVQPGDTIRSLLYWDATNGQSGSGTLSGVGPLKGGDLRVGSLTSQVPATSFMPHPDYFGSQSRACVLRGGDGTMYFPVGSSPARALMASGNIDMTKEGTLGNQIVLSGTNKMNANAAFGNLPWGGGVNVKAAVNGVYRQDKVAGDWDTGLGSFPDGPYANKQDEGNIIYRYLDPYTHQYIYPIPYFTATYSYQQPGDSFTSPSRQMPSPVMFGSLPAHAAAGRNWETLNFCPNPAGLNHPGNIDPKDHLLLDLFQMPIVEPYPISEPFSTAGKVNLNYRIVPFDYIRRSTALRAALYSVRVTAVPSGKAATSGTATAYYSIYKTGFPASTPITNNFRLLLDRDQTIAELDSVYDGAGTPPTPNGNFFKTASQICEEFLIPWGVKWTTTSAMQTWWTQNGDLTGDNCREKPYADLYPRLTTKSNTYTVHMRVQTLRQIPRNVKSGANAYGTWNEGKDAVLAEYRGSTTIERYLDPADPRIGSSTYNGSPQTNPDTQSLEKLYRFRTVLTKKFSQ